MAVSYDILTPIVGLLGLLVAFGIFRSILRVPIEAGKANEIAGQIQLGARVFLLGEFKVLALFVLAIGFLIGFANDVYQAAAFGSGAVASSFAGTVGMFTATRANVRTAIIARDKNGAHALRTAFLGGSIMGLVVASVGLIGLGTLFLLFVKQTGEAHVLHGFAMGASVVALFFRVGGGIFTKAADVGADLVGKVEAGIPEDDRRNPGVIADNVGDNVGDIGGMGSDIFESYCGAQVASIAIAATLSTEAMTAIASDQAGLFYLPLALTTLGLLCSIIGIWLVGEFSQHRPLDALRFGTVGAAFLFMTLSYGLTQLLGVAWTVWASLILGGLGGILIGINTEYYTAGRPVKSIAQSSETGVATVMLSGLATGMQSVALPLLSFGVIIFVSSTLAGIYGIGIAAVGMLATVGITMAIDAYGPVADNAGGIAEMAEMSPETRRITDSLDEAGNTTAAIGKGFAIGAAGLAALTLITAYVNTVRAHHIPNLTLDITDSRVLFGLFIGGGIPFVVASMLITAVGQAAAEMITEIRRQFRDIAGLLEGTSDPDTARCVDIATRAALERMMPPSLIAVGAPVLVGFTLGAAALGGLLIGALLSGVLLALLMANSGGAWDNAKKLIEQGFVGGKGSDSHNACVIGDTVGDPLKDTAGPSMNILINVMAIVSLVLAPLLTR